MTSFVAIFAGHVASLLEFFGLEFLWPVLFVLEILRWKCCVSAYGLPEQPEALAQAASLEQPPERWNFAT